MVVSRQFITSLPWLRQTVQKPPSEFYVKVSKVAGTIFQAKVCNAFSFELLLSLAGSSSGNAVRQLLNQFRSGYSTILTKSAMRGVFSFWERQEMAALPRSVFRHLDAAEF